MIYCMYTGPVHKYTRVQDRESGLHSGCFLLSVYRRKHSVQADRLFRCFLHFYCLNGLLLIIELLEFHADPDLSIRLIGQDLRVHISLLSQ